MKIGFIGFGNMAQALAEGFLLKQAAVPEDIYACARNWEKLEANAKKYGICPCRDAAETAERSDLVVVADKPYQVEEVLTPVKELLKDKIVVSVAAGMPFETYERFLAPGTRHISTVPNTPVSIGEGIVVCEDIHSLTDEDYRQFRELFSQVGVVVSVGTKLLGIAGTVCGCGPAFAAMFIEALADAAVLHGIPRDLAYQMASQVVAGTGKLQEASGTHPAAMKDAVCSPGGTTIVGVAALERKGFRSAVIDAVDAVEHKKK